jgi:hypothetical protein
VAYQARRHANRQDEKSVSASSAGKIGMAARSVPSCQRNSLVLRKGTGCLNSQRMTLAH